MRCFPTTVTLDVMNVYLDGMRISDNPMRVLSTNKDELGV